MGASGISAAWRLGAQWLRDGRAAPLPAPEDVWPDAARMALAAIGAFAICRAVGLHNGFFAILTALLMVRPSGTSKSSLLDRLVGVGVGVGVALGLHWLLHSRAPEIVQVALAMVPLCYLVARFRKYQIAPIIAIAVLSAGMGMNSALHFLLARLLEIGIGFVVGVAVSLVVFRRSRDLRSRQHAADMLRGCGALVVGAASVGRSGRDVGLRNRIRADLRLVTVTSPVLSGPGRKLRRAHIIAMNRLQLDLMFLAQALADLKLAWRARARATLDRLAHSFEMLCREAADAIVGSGPVPDFGSFDAAIRALNVLSASRSMPVGDEANEALPFLLRRLRADLHEVLTGYVVTTNSRDIDVTIEDPADTAPPASGLVG